MKKISYRILLSIFVLTIFITYNKNIYFIADYKEITIVYGLLDSDDSISYLRIQREHLAEGNIMDKQN